MHSASNAGVHSAKVCMLLLIEAVLRSIQFKYNASVLISWYTVSTMDSAPDAGVGSLGSPDAGVHSKYKVLCSRAWVHSYRN
jgi:hypothetical protein